MTITGSNESVFLINLAFAGTSSSFGLLSILSPSVGVEVNLFRCVFFPQNSRGIFLDAPLGMSNVLQAFDCFMQTAGTGAGVETRESCEVNWRGGQIQTTDPVAIIGGTSEQRYLQARLLERLSVIDSGRGVLINSGIQSPGEVISLTTGTSVALATNTLIQSVGPDWCIGTGTLQTPGNNPILTGSATIAGSVTVTSLPSA